MRPQRILLVFKAFLLIMLFATTVYADTPLVSVFGPDVFIRQNGEPIIEEIVFEVPLAGSAVMYIKNGAEDDDSTGEKVSSSIILLNDICVAGPNDFNQNINAIQVPVELQAGENVLAVELRSKPGGCISIKISALIDSIDLAPISEPIELGVDPLACQAVLAGLGVPAEGVDVLFQVSGFDGIPPLTGQTDSTGVAHVTFSPFTTIGTGAVSATVVDSDPVLTDSEEFEVKKIQEITLDQGLTTMNVEVGSSQYIAFTIGLAGAGGQTCNVSFEQNISPDNGGIILSSDYPGGWSTSTDKIWLVNEFITGVALGIYTVTSSATIVETGEVVTSELIVNVFDPNVETPTLWQPGVEPEGIEPNTPTDVTFSVFVTESSSSLSLKLEQVIDENNTQFVGFLSDNGLNGDMVAGDNIYSGTFAISAADIGTLYYRTATSHGGYDYVSEECTLTITGLPVGPGLSDPYTLVEDPATGTCLYSNEVIVAFFDLISEDRIQEIIAGEGGTIVGTIPALGVYQISIPGDGTATGVQAAIEAFEGYPEVEYAEANVHSAGGGAVEPDSSLQWGPVKIRADEAWVLGRGANVIVAVVDSGVDYNHSDLSGKVIKGKDFVGNDNDPMDEHSHGTHVAGIIGAMQNGSGISGIASGGKIYAVRVLDASNSGTWLNIAAGIEAAAKSAKIINYSVWEPAATGYADTTVHNAIKAAVKKGRLCVGIAGNHGKEDKNYPGAFEETFCVGNTTSTDGRSSSSGYGPWVDIAAPGTSIYSTVLSNNYGNKSGTSMAAPHVAGAAAVIWSMHPSWTAAQVRERLEKTSEPLASTLKLGAGRLDLFEAVFNGSFEIGDLSEWSKTGTCSSLNSLGALVPQHRKRMGYASTGPSGDQVAATLEKTFTIQPGVTSIPIKFEYNFVTEEYPEWVGTIFDDALRITLTAPDGTETVLATESVNGSSFTMYTDSPAIDFPGGDNTVGQTGWKPASATIPVTQGSGTYKIKITDAGDDIYDSVVLIDNIRLK